MKRRHGKTRGPSGEPRINQAIRAREVRLIDQNGRMAGVVLLHRALAQAREQGLDLVEVQATASPPVCRIMDYGRYRYEMRKRAKEGRKKQHSLEEKGIRFRVNTGPHDLETKIRRARAFLEDGFRVVFTVRLRGIEWEHQGEAEGHFRRCAEELADVGKVEQPVRLDGSTMMMSMIPLPKKGAPSPRKPPGKPDAAGEKPASGPRSEGGG